MLWLRGVIRLVFKYENLRALFQSGIPILALYAVLLVSGGIVVAAVAAYSMGSIIKLVFETSGELLRNGRTDDQHLVVTLRRNLFHA